MLGISCACLAGTMTVSSIFVMRLRREARRQRRWWAPRVQWGPMGVFGYQGFSGVCMGLFRSQGFSGVPGVFLGPRGPMGAIREGMPVVLTTYAVQDDR